MMNALDQMISSAGDSFARRRAFTVPARESAQGFAFSADTTWQRELEESFPFVETPDQLVAIHDEPIGIRGVERFLGDFGLKLAEILQVAQTIMSGGKIDYLDGITIDFGDWWFNVRKSNTEPLLRLNLEAKTPAEVQAKVDAIARTGGMPLGGLSTTSAVLPFGASSTS